MISEERLKELIEQEASVFYYNDELHTINLNKEKHFVCISDDVLSLLEKKENYEENINWCSRLYENKEEAEFVAKYHCSKTIKFEPPVFEEFEKSKTEFSFAFWHSNNISIYHYPEYAKYTPNCMEVVDYNDRDNTRLFRIKNNNYKQAYYQAVEYAKKLFLGESDETT